jgi:uncharacterized membrane protein YphA (DoxX/SURF4 family)
MKGLLALRWIVTGLMATLMLLSAIPDILRVPEALSVFRHLGYPPYLLPFLGTAKTLGVLAVLVPGIPRLKEWAFAGLTFDVSGALYSHLSVGDPPNRWMPAMIGLTLIAGSYVAYRMQAHRDAASRNQPASAQGHASVTAFG